MKLGEDFRHVKGGDFVIFPMIFDTLDLGVQGVNFEGSFFGILSLYSIFTLKDPRSERVFCFLGPLFTCSLALQETPWSFEANITCSCLLFDLLTLEVNRECL